MNMRMRTRRYCLLSLVAGALCGFCGCPADPGATDPTLVVIEGPAGNILRTSVQSTMTGEIDDLNIGVNKGALSINGKAFGKVEPGNKVKIDTEGKVFVNGMRREEAKAE